MIRNRTIHIFTLNAILGILSLSCAKTGGQSQSAISQVAEATDKDGHGILSTTGSERISSSSNTQKDIIGKIVQESHDCKNEPMASKSILRLLTKDEYQNSVRDVLGVSTDYRSGLPAEVGKAGFKNNADVGTLSDSHVSAYLETAIQIGDEVLPKLKTLVGCTQSERAACAARVVETIAPALWRRPLTTEESNELIVFYNAIALKSPSEAMKAVVARMLTSAHFLYRSEIGKNGELTPYELASALSYFFWGTVPDSTLLALASNGTLANEDVLLTQANRLFDSGKSKYLMSNFSEGWLSYKRVQVTNKDAKTYPQWNDGIKLALSNEAEQTFDYLVRQPSSKFETLFVNDSTVGPAKLAEYYGAESVTENGVNKIKFTGSSRQGVLGFGAILSALATNAESHPFRRGGYVLEHMLCHIPDPVPEGADFNAPPVDLSLSTRERFAQHSASPACKSCHVKIDGIGLGMEDFDGIGLYRSQDNGKKVDSSGELIGFDGGNSKFDGVSELSKLLSESNQAQRCFVIQWHRYGSGYMEREQDICSIRDIADQFQQGKLSLKELIIKTITHKSYLKRGN